MTAERDRRPGKRAGVNGAADSLAYYRDLCNDLGARLLRLRDEQTSAMKEAMRSRAAVRLVRRLHELDNVELPLDELPAAFLEATLTTLPADQGVLFQYDHAARCYHAISALGQPQGARLGPLAIEPTAFCYANAETPDDELRRSISELLGTPYFVFVHDEPSGLALALGNLVQNRHVHHGFEEADREIGEAALDVYINLAKRKRAEAQLRHDAMHDSLTGLPNRNLFLAHLDQAIGRYQRHSEKGFAVLFIDLDRFKLVNDGLGHSVGDQLLAGFGQRLKGLLRPGDVVARLGGDEFAILVSDLDEPGQADRTVTRVHEALGTPFDLAGQQVRASASIGVAHIKPETRSGDDLLRDADIAMYSAKDAGGGRHQNFDEQLHRATLARLSLEDELRQALARSEFELYLQPIVDLRWRRLASFEALLRWRHPQRGLLEPAAFIDAAEDTGQIIGIGAWVIETACDQIAVWQRTFGFSPPISVNLSDREFFHPSLSGLIDHHLKRSGASPSSLRLELTERILLQHSESELNVLERLKALGPSLMIDDFGTGYSSLNRLSRLSIDTLKIAPAFVTGMEEKPRRGEIVRTIIDLAHNLGMDVVAEGVETHGQARMLRRHRCEYAQGFYLQRPVPQADAEALIEDPGWIPALD